MTRLALQVVDLDPEIDADLTLSKHPLPEVLQRVAHGITVDETFLLLIGVTISMMRFDMEIKVVNKHLPKH